MPTFYQADGWKIKLYADDHAPPHFHVETPNGAESVRLSDLKILKGGVQARIHHRAMKWARENKPHLLVEWERLNQPRH